MGRDGAGRQMICWRSSRASTSRVPRSWDCASWPTVTRSPSWVCCFLTTPRAAQSGASSWLSDWYAFSGHKVFGPTGVGVLHGKRDLLDAMPPWQGGGNMIRDVTFERILYGPPPARFEAGTSSIADAVGLGAALDYLQRIGMHNVARHEQDLLAHATAGLADVPGLQLIGTARDKAAVLSFVLDGLTPERIGEALDREGIAVRAGHHCAQPIVRRFGHEGTVRAALALYNTHEDIDALITALRRIATRSVRGFGR